MLQQYFEQLFNLHLPADSLKEQSILFRKLKVTVSRNAFELPVTDLLEVVNEPPGALGSQAGNSWQFSKEAGQPRGFFPLSCVIQACTTLPLAEYLTLQLVGYLWRVRLTDTTQDFLQWLFHARNVHSSWSRECKPRLSLQSYPLCLGVSAHTRTHNLSQ